MGASGPGYRETVELLNRQGPKYQYGTGCLSDGVLGFWMAKVCGLDQDIVDPAKVRSNLQAIHRYNLKENLLDHANPQRSASESRFQTTPRSLTALTNASSTA